MVHSQFIGLSRSMHNVLDEVDHAAKTDAKVLITGESVGAGRTLSIRALTVDRLRRTLQDVLDRSAYHDSARRMRHAILEAGGVRRAASVIGDLIAQ